MVDYSRAWTDYLTALGGILIDSGEKVYEFLAPEHARRKRMVLLAELKESGMLERMTFSEVEQFFGITRESNEF